MVEKSKSSLDTLTALTKAKLDEFLLSYLRCGQKNNNGDEDNDNDENQLMPTWHGMHTLISNAKPH